MWLSLRVGGGGSERMSMRKSLVFTPRSTTRMNQKAWFVRSSSSHSNSNSNQTEDGLTFHDFLSPPRSTTTTPPTITPTTTSQPKFQFYIQTYGCQMNVNDSDIVRTLLLNHQHQIFQETKDEPQAHLILTNTCAIREHAEQKVWNRLQSLHHSTTNKNNSTIRVIGVLGCMAERVKEQLLRATTTTKKNTSTPLVDFVLGPDEYRQLPALAIQSLLDKQQKQQQKEQQKQKEQQRLAKPSTITTTTTSSPTRASKHHETYEDITPTRSSPSSSSPSTAFVSIQRGCSNRCSFCIVPFTRGNERSRPLQTVLQECQTLVLEHQVKEITLLGQNVNSYHDTSPQALLDRPLTQYTLSNSGFRSRIRRNQGGYFFADLLQQVANIHPELRVRFTSPHPKDYPHELLHLMKETNNICNSLHMPAQSGSTTMLQRMKRGYTREAYLELIQQVRDILPDVGLSSDFIAGFCHESREEHADTCSLLAQVRFDQAFLFAYSAREPTHAQRTYTDDVPHAVKQARLRELIDLFQSHVQEKNQQTEIGQRRLVLLEGPSKRSQPGARQWHGRTDQNKRIVFPVDEEASCREDDDDDYNNGMEKEGTPPPTGRLQDGDYAVVEVTDARGHTLRGKLLYRTTQQRFYEQRNKVEYNSIVGGV